ncbi:MAG: PaaI family thioesterase [Brotaphodocola sp.]
MEHPEKDQEKEYKKEYEIREHRIKESIPWSETCFGCNGGTNEGIGMRAYISEDDYVVGICDTKELHQGFPGVIHGGIVGTYLDEILWHATRLKNPDLIAMTVEMTVRYKKPVRPGMRLRVVAEPAKFDGRHIYVNGYILLPDDTIAATAETHYIEVRQDAPLNQEERTRQKHPSAWNAEIVSVRF